MSSLKNLWSVASLASVVGLLALAGCAANKDCCKDDGKSAAAATDKTATKTTQAAALTVVNTACPISGEDLGSKDHTAKVVRTYNGENVGFCCDGCGQKFDKMSDEKKAATLTSAKSR